MYIYFPSCKFTAAHPGMSVRIREYLSSEGVRIADCCRLTHGELGDGDVALTICQTCNIIVSENHPENRVMSVFEYIDATDGLEVPDLGGERITVQDCCRAWNHHAEKAAVRSLLKKMNAEVVELPGLPEEENFDGTFTLSPTTEANARLAPAYFRGFERYLKPMAPEEQEAYLRDYCRRFETKRVVCYCNSCLTGLKTGLPEGKQAVHLAELLWGTR